MDTNDNKGKNKTLFCIKHSNICIILEKDIKMRRKNRELLRRTNESKRERQKIDVGEDDKGR